MCNVATHPYYQSLASTPTPRIRYSAKKNWSCTNIINSVWKYPEEGNGIYVIPANMIMAPFSLSLTNLDDLQSDLFNSFRMDVEMQTTCRSKFFNFPFPPFFFIKNSKN